MNITSRCFALFVDIYENLYCSLLNNHRVDKKWSNSIISIESTKWINKTNNQTYLSNRDCSRWWSISFYCWCKQWSNNWFRWMSFDSYGNIYVTDQRNLIVSMKIVRFSRNQRPKSHFLLLTNHCFAWVFSRFNREIDPC